jgi:D-xylose transport system ATP-binding protein
MNDSGGSVATATRTPVLALKGVSKSFGAVQALTDVDIEVYPGEVLALVGDNGAGKSTLIKVLAGVHAASSGSIEFDGHAVSIHSPADARALGISTVFQDLALADNLDVVGNLFLGAEMKRGVVMDEIEMEKRSWQLLAELSAKIPSVRNPVAALSGGQRQTVAIARALLGSPKVVVLDEPTAALGVAQTAQVLDLIKRLRERGYGVIVISHNMDDVRQVADRIAVLRLGRNNGTFNTADVTMQDVIAAMTGATLVELDQAVEQAAAQHSSDPGSEGGAL